jgi:hypothetical protein
MVDENKSRGIQRKLKNLEDKTSLSDEEIALLKTWKDSVTNKFSEIDGRLDILENKADIAQSKFIDIEARLDALENP